MLCPSTSVTSNNSKNIIIIFQRDNSFYKLKFNLIYYFILSLNLGDNTSQFSGKNYPIVQVKYG